MKRLFFRALLVLLLLIPSTFAFVVATDPGVRLLATLVNSFGAGRVSMASASGSLVGVLEMSQLQVTDNIDSVTVEKLRLRWNPAGLLHGEITVEEVRLSGVVVRLGPGSPGNYEPPPLSLPVRLLLRAVAVDNLTIYNLQDLVVSQASGRLGQATWKGQELRVDDLSFEALNFSLQAKGGMKTVAGYPLNLAVDYSGVPDGYAQIAGTATAEGPINALACDIGNNSPLAARLKGTLENILGETTWKAILTSDQVVLSKVHQGWSAQPYLKVQINGQGTLDEYALQVKTQTPVPGSSNAVDLDASLQGDANGLRIDALRMRQQKAALTAKGHLNWSPAFSWQAEVVGSHLDPSLLSADWAGDLACAVKTDGTMRDGTLEAHLLLDELQGTLRGFPLTGHGEAHLAGNQLHIPQLQVQSGTSVVRVSGNAADTADLSFALESKNLAELWPNASGSIKARGQLTGKTAEPQVDLELTGAGIAYQGDGVDRLTVEAHGVAAAQGSINAKIKAERLHQGGLKLDTAQVKVEGSMGSHAATLEGTGADLVLGVRVQGKVVNHEWQGVIEQARLSARNFGDWRQGRGAVLTIGADKAVLQPFCLAAANSGDLCLEGSWSRPEERWQAQAEISSLSLDLLQRVIGSQWPVEGNLKAKLKATGRGADLVEGSFDCDATGVQAHLTVADGDSQALVWRSNLFHAGFASGRLQASVESELNDGSVLHAQLIQENVTLPGSDLLKTPMSGSLKFTLKNLAPLTALTDQMVLFSGVLQGGFAMQGTATNPLLTGQLDLIDGQAEIPQLGLAIKPLSLTMKGDADRLQLAATAHSGQGDLRAESTLDLAHLDKKDTVISISGDQFQAAALPGLDLTMTPDLKLTLSNNRGELHGTIRIPEATVTSVDFYTTVPASDDMVVVDNDQPGSPTAQWPFSANVTLTAGDKVQIDAFGLEGRIAGSLQVVAQPGRPLLGNGTLSVLDGSFTSYGRNLKIDVGQLLFTGGPLTNPGIELRSENRKDNVTAGLVVEGFLQRPEISFYSTPHMEQAVIVSQLLESESFGGSSRKETGLIGKAATMTGLGGLVPYLEDVKELTMIDDIKLDTGKKYDSLSLVFGSWLTPRFYVSYGKNLTKESGSFNSSYTLGKGFYLKTETGPTQSGGDIKYEFER